MVSGRDDSSQGREGSVWAIVVTYNPDLEVLARQVDTLVSQVCRIVIVDNGSTCNLAGWLPGCWYGSVELVLLEKNLGIATAHNRGIERAQQAGADYVLLMDQDSLPQPNMVAELLRASRAGSNVAAVGPRYLDERQNNPPPFIRIEGMRIKRLNCQPQRSVVAVDYLISSGCLISLAVLRKVGGMRDDLFIDYVDIEWGLRAKHFGLQSYGCCTAHMLHTIGDEPVRFWGRRIPMHHPLRHYYHFRNAILLYKLPWISLNWKMVDGLRLCLKYVFYSLFSRDGLSQWRMMTLGVWHGLAGRSGCYDNG
ncbi:MAG: glycosyltransferase family 2 protein [Desulfuromonadaceae bacterium]|nr:glycosyltransferase family 2 protein [Desulfuromonadaceae bacterium]